ncbi:AraC family transcriptional regulator N-terminal domain-containing protein [Promicromonospora sp. Populi]|uniref:AraC family transcriptional regulator n=1 Tax=Promicromonospora sp. Populi TaxID=3239420 RepID=UPI0034E26E1E
MSALHEARALVTSLGTRPEIISLADGVTVLATPKTTVPLGGVLKPNLAVVLQGTKRAVLGTHVYEYGSAQLLAVGVDLPLTSSITAASTTEPFLAFGMALQPEIIADLLLEAPALARRGRRVEGPVGLAMGDADDELLDVIVRLLRSVRSAHDYRVLGPGILRELHWRLLSGPQGHVIRELGSIDSRRSVVDRAVRWLQDNFDGPLRVDELARSVDVSPATLNRHFRAVTTMSPLQYQKTLRLQRARIMLLAAHDDVSRVGYAVGYGSASQFSREYRRMFGAPPSQDAELLRHADVTIEA